MKFVGTELPKPTGNARKHKAQTVIGRRAASLRQHPGEWAKWPASTTSTEVKAALAKHGGTFEVRSVTINGKQQAFARYIKS